ncbi:hypothetical protein LTR67_006522 [Exophiala xenobiotica]
MSTGSERSPSPAPWPSCKPPPTSKPPISQVQLAEDLWLLDESAGESSADEIPAMIMNKKRKAPGDDGSEYQCSESETNLEGSMPAQKQHRMNRRDSRGSDFSMDPAAGELPEKPQEGPFILDGKVRWDLGKDSFPSAAQYEEVREKLKQQHCACKERYPADRRWEASFKEMTEALNINYADLMAFTEDWLDNPSTAKADWTYSPATRNEARPYIIKFSKVYAEYMYRAHHIKPPRKAGRRKKSELQETVGMHPDSDTVGAKPANARMHPVSEGGGSECGSDAPKKARLGNLQKLGGVKSKADWGDRTKSWKQLAELHALKVAERLNQGQGYWRRDGKISTPSAEHILFAKDNQGNYIIPQAKWPKLVENYTGFMAQREKGKDLLNREGQPRQRAPKKLSDTHDESTGKFNTNIKSEERQKSDLNFYTSIRDSVFDNKTGTVKDPPKLEDKKLRDVKAKVYKQAGENAVVRAEAAEAREAQRQALVKLDKEKKEKETLAIAFEDKSKAVRSLELETAKMNEQLGEAQGDRDSLRWVYHAAIADIESLTKERDNAVEWSQCLHQALSDSALREHIIATYTTLDAVNILSCAPPKNS